MFFFPVELIPIFTLCSALILLCNLVSPTPCAAAAVLDRIQLDAALSFGKTSFIYLLNLWLCKTFMPPARFMQQAQV